MLNASPFQFLLFSTLPGYEKWELDTPLDGFLDYYPFKFFAKTFFNAVSISIIDVSL
jgi:hypothetical protein